MKKRLNEELNDIKYLFNYDRGRIISEQEVFGDEEFVNEEGDFDWDEISNDDETFEDEFSEIEMSPGTKEKERIKVDPGTKPKQPKTPYRPKPGPKPDPKAKRKGDMPEWLSFDELGIDFE